MALYRFTQLVLGALLHVLRDNDLPLALTHLKDFAEVSLSSPMPETNVNAPEALKTYVFFRSGPMKGADIKLQHTKDLSAWWMEGVKTCSDCT